MTLNIKSPKAEKLAREIAKEAGESPAEAVLHALEERLHRLRGRKHTREVEAAILGVSAHCRALPNLDDRTPEQILSYDQSGTFG